MFDMVRTKYAKFCLKPGVDVDAHQVDKMSIKFSM